MNLLVVPLIFLIFNNSLAEELKCELSFHFDGYNCDMENDFQTKKEVTSVHGLPMYGNGFADVEVFYQNDRNPSKYLPTKICSEMRNVNKFAVHGKKLVEIKKELFDGCTNLKTVAIRYITLKTIDEDLLTLVQNLQVFDLTESKVETLPAKLFEKNMNTLKNVDLKFNRLKVIKTEFPATLTSLSLVGNDCSDEQYTKTFEQSKFNEFIQKMMIDCGQENAILPAKTHGNIVSGVLEQQIDENSRFISALETKVDKYSNDAYDRHTTLLNEVKALKVDLNDALSAQNKSIQMTNELIKPNQENFNKTASKIKDEIAEIQKLFAKMQEDVNRNGNFTTFVFSLQVLVIAFVVLAIIYMRFFSNERFRHSTLVTNGDL